LHPQLGSVFGELRKNPCFKKLGTGYWAFDPDPRIERILPEVLKPKQEDDLNKVEENVSTNTDKQDTIDVFQEDLKFEVEPKKEDFPTSMYGTTIIPETESVVEREPSPHLEANQLILIESKKTVNSSYENIVQREDIARLPRRIKLRLLKTSTSIKIFFKDLFKRCYKILLKIF
ncbi:MAG: hypothetical protein ABSC53_11410, partial [Bacteroidota bacterium]